MHKATWISPDGETTNQIDHILIDRRQRTIITNVRIYRGANYDSNHYLVMGMYRARIQKMSQHYRKEQEKISLVQL
jgi:hypothetical protein